MSTYASWKEQMRKLPNRFDLDGLCELLGIKPLNIEAFDGSDTYMYARQDALAHGSTEDEADEIALKAEQDEQDEYFNKFKHGVEHVAEKFFSEHKLKVIPVKWEYKIEPADGATWFDAAVEIKNTINGVGYFYFSSTKEFMESGPYTARQAVLSHLGYVRQWAAVYGDASPQNALERYLR